MNAAEDRTGALAGGGPPASQPPAPGYARSELRAGLFVLAALFVVGFFYFFGRDVSSLLRPHKRLVVWLEDTAGLEGSASVRKAGMTIGKVTDIRIVEAADHKIEVGLRVLASVPLREGTVASVRSTEWVIGKYIDLSGGGVDAPLLSDGAVIPGTEEPSIDEVVNSAGRIILNVRDIAGEVDRLVKEKRLEELVDNLNRMARIAGSPDDNLLFNLQTALKSLVDKGVIQDVTTILQAIAQNKDRVLALVERGNDLTVQSSEMLLRHKKEIESLVTNLSQITEAFSSRAGNLTTLSDQSVAIAAELPGLIEQTKSLLGRLDGTLASLDKLMARAEAVDETAIRKFIQQEGMRIYFLKSQAPPFPDPGTADEAPPEARP